MGSATRLAFTASKIVVRASRADPNPTPPYGRSNPSAPRSGPAIQSRKVDVQDASRLDLVSFRSDQHPIQIALVHLLKRPERTLRSCPTVHGRLCPQERQVESRDLRLATENDEPLDGVL